MAKKPDERVRLRRCKVREKFYDRFEIDLGYDESGKRKRRSFSSYEAAEQELKKLDALRKRIGRAAKQLSDDHLQDATKALTQLEGATSLRDAADFWMKHNRPVGAGGQVTCKALLDTYSEKARRAGRRPATLSELVSGTRRFVEPFGDTPRP
jgi:transposase InsO family protein